MSESGKTSQGQEHSMVWNEPRPVSGHCWQVSIGDQQLAINSLPNARLIAAAPDLLQALETIELINHPDSDTYNPLCKGSPTEAEFRDRLVEFARDFIAKARGAQ